MRPDQETTTEVRATAAAVAAPVLLVPFALISALVVGRWAPLHELDESVTGRLNTFAHAHPGWVDAMAWWSLIFHPATWRIAAAALVIWLWARRRERSLALWAGTTMATGALFGVLLKLLFGRHRPDLLDPVAQATGYAFPSGHALTSALGATVFLMVLLPMTARPPARAGLWVAGVVLPLVTAFTRVGLGVHWMSDVVAGSLLGVALALLTRLAFDRRRGNRAGAGLR